MPTTRINYLCANCALRSIPLLCNPRATALSSVTRYGRDTSVGRAKQRAPAMMAHVLNQGRLFGLRSKEYSPVTEVRGCVAFL